MEVHIRGEVFDGSLEKITFGEAERIESVLGKPYSQFETDLREGSAKAWVAYVWTLLRRTHPDIRVADVQDMAQAEVEFVLPAATPAEDDAAVPGGESPDPTQKVSEQPDETPS